MGKKIGRERERRREGRYERLERMEEKKGKIKCKNGSSVYIKGLVTHVTSRTKRPISCWLIIIPRYCYIFNL